MDAVQHRNGKEELESRTDSFFDSLFISEWFCSLDVIGSGGVSYGLKAMVNLCLGMLKVMKGK